MQSWSNAGHNGAEGHADQWQSNFAFPGQNGQFDPHQAWPQPIPDQDAYSHLNTQDASASNFFHSAHPDSGFLTGNLHGTSSSQPGFHPSHDALALNHQQFSQPGQDVIDPSFSDIHPDLYAQQGKMNLGDSMNHMTQVQGHPHGHSQGFAQHGYQFQPQTEQSYESPIQQFAQPHVIPQQNRQQTHTPTQQQYEGIQDAFGHSHNFGRPPLQSPVHGQQGYNQNAAFPPPVNGQGNQYQANAHANYQQPQPQQHHQQQQQQQQPAYSQSPYAPQKPLAYTQAGQNPPVQAYQQPIHHQATFVPAPSPANTASNAQYGTVQQPIDLESGQTQPVAVEPPAKKRKRVTKAAAEVAIPEPVITHADSPMELVNKKMEEIDALVPPTPSPEEAQMIAQFNKRSKAAQTKYPSIKGLPHLVFNGTIKLPAPKSYDKLAPLVALPPRSGQPIVPELGYDLPCEVQGRFTSRYRPSPDKGGLDDRRIEAKVLLDEFDRSMKALGKRRPKYTEYPHAFKEQLKSDEATKNKAEKKARKEQEEEERNKPIRSPTRPADPVEAAAWDIIGIVHIEQSASRTSALIAGRVQQAGDYIIKLRGEMNRAKQELDQAVKDKQSEAQITKIRQETEHKKEVLWKALDAVIEHADDGVLDNLGGHQKMVLSLVNALIMCIKLNDFSGKLPKVILELFTHFPMTRKIAETANFETVRKRFADKGDEDIKESARQIAARMRKVLKTAEPETSTGYTGTSAASRAKAVTKPAADGSTKRGRDDDSDSRTVKKIAVESTGSSLSKKLAQPKIQLQSASKTTAAKAAASSILPGKARPVAKSVPRPDAPKADGKSAVDEKAKTDVKNVLSKIENGKPASGKAEPKPPAPSSSALSGIASLLDSINAPKAEIPVVAPKEPKEPEFQETPDARAKRLRREARRKLRVSWKPESELVQIKIFQKEEAEDEGREMNMIRDAGDDRSEGMVLKQRANVADEDDDDDIPYSPWLGPLPFDFSGLFEGARKKNFATRGGQVTFTTDEQKRIAEREQRELMVIYTDPNDIPPTPKSPPSEMAIDYESRTGQLPNDDAKFEEVRLRWRDEQQMGVEGSLYAAVKRLEDKQNPSNRLDSILGRLKTAPSSSQTSYHATASAQNSPTATDTNVPLVVGRGAEDQVLAVLKSDNVKNWRDPNPIQADVLRAHHYADPTVQLSAGAVEAVAKSLGGKSFPATSPPEWLMHDEERVREWRLGYSKEAAARQKRDDEQRARAEAEANALKAATASVTSGQAPGNSQDWTAYYAHAQQQQAYMAFLQQMTGGQQPAQQQPSISQGQQSQIPDTQLQSILAAINQPGQQQQQQQHQQLQHAQSTNPANYLNPNDPSYQQYMLLLAQGAPPPPPPPPLANDRDWDRSDEQQPGRGEQRDGKDGRRKRGTLPPHKPANKALIGTKPCTFWQQGKCARGDKCTFRHD